MLEETLKEVLKKKKRGSNFTPLPQVALFTGSGPKLFDSFAPAQALKECGCLR